MPRLLRRAIAVVVTLSVLLSTLGLAHASCDGMRHMNGMGDMAGMAGMANSAAVASTTDDAPRGDPMEHCGTMPAPGERGSTDAGCLLVAHCGTTMLADRTEVPFVAVAATSRVIAADDARPLAPAREPDSPPPRA